MELWSPTSARRARGLALWAGCVFVAGACGGSPAGRPDAGGGTIRWDGGIGPVLSFGAPVEHLVLDATSVAVGDIDGDDDVDLVIGTDTAGVHVLVNAGTGTFTPALAGRSEGRVSSVGLGDVDGDGDRDLLLLTNSDAREHLELRYNDGRGGFGAATGYDTGGGGWLLTIGDLDGDGRADVVVGDTIQLLVFQDDDRGGLQTARAFQPGGTVDGLAVADLDGDGRADVAIADGMSGSITVIPSLASGDFGVPARHPAAAGPTEVALADADGDGRLDVFFAGGWPSIAVMLNQGDRRFGAARETEVRQPPLALGAADLDGDGKAELIMADGGDEFSGRLHVSRGVGDGSFDLPIRYDVGLNRLAFADLNGDGQRDLVGIGLDNVVVLTNRSRAR
jgi:hypothetical protein